MFSIGLLHNTLVSFLCLEGMRHLLLEGHLQPSLPRLLEVEGVAQPRTYSRYGVLIQRAVGLW